MSGTQLGDDSPSCRNWSSIPELNESQEAFLSPSTDYDDEEFLRYLWKEYLHPREYEWVLIAGYIIVFIVALIGNVLGEYQPPALCSQELASKPISNLLKLRLQRTVARGASFKSSGEV